jgi:hypothetical protein
MGVEHQALDPVVGVETDASDAHLHDPRSHLLGLRGYGDGPGDLRSEA